MPVRKDEHGNYHYVPGPAIRQFGPAVTRAVAKGVAESLPAPSKPVTPSRPEEGPPGPGKNFDITSYQTQKGDVESMLASEQGLIGEAEANGIDTKALGGLIAGNSDKSVMGRVFDVLSRPNYMVANTVAQLKGYDDGYTESDDPIEAAWEGLTGNAKTTFTKMYSEKVDPNAPAGGVRGSVGAPILGLISDLVLDPTTYIGVGAVKTGGSALIGGGKTAEVVDNASKLGKAINATKAGPASRVAEAIKDTPKVIDAALQTGSQVGRMDAFRTALKATKPTLNAPLPSGTAASTGRTLVRAGDARAVDTVLKSEPLLQSGKAAGLLKQKIGNNLGRQFKATATAQGIDTSTAAYRVAERKVRKYAIDQAVGQAQKRMDDALETVRAIDKTRETSVGLKFGGKTIVRSRNAGRASDKVNALWKSTGVGQLMRRGFIPGADINNATLHHIQQITANVSSSQWEDQIKGLKAVFDGKAPGFARTSSRERAAITDALEAGTDKFLPPQLKPHYAEARQVLDDAAGMKVSAGLMEPTDILPNFVPHHYRKPNNLPVGVKRAPSLGDAARYGADPRKDIAELLSLHLADTYRMVGRQKMIDNMGSMFGMVRPSGKSRQGAEITRLLKKGELIAGEKIHPSLKGMAFDREIARSMTSAIDVFKKTDDTTGFLRVYDNALSKVKFILTAPNPGFHIRNFTGDIFVNWLDGIADPRTYSTAARVVSGGNGAAIPAIKKIPALDAQDVRQWYDAMGLRSGFFHADVAGHPTGSVLSRIKEHSVGEAAGRAGDSVTGAIKNASEKREDFTRMAHFIGALEDEARHGAKTIEEAAEAAAMRVRKYNFDYQDLTHMERTFMRRAIPFYTYMRKSMPLMLSMIFTKPGKVATTDKSMKAIAAILGTSGDESEGALPGISGVVPSWLSDMTNVQLQDESQTQDAVYWAPDLPIQQLNSFFGGFDEGVVPGIEKFGREVAGGATPIARMPLEQFTGHDWATGAPVSDSWFDRAASLVPGARAAIGDSGKDALHQGPEYDIGPFTLEESLINYLTGAGVRKVTPARQKSEIMRRDQPLKDRLKKAKNESRIDSAQNPGLPTPEEILAEFYRLKAGN